MVRQSVHPARPVKTVFVKKVLKFGVIVAMTEIVIAEAVMPTVRLWVLILIAVI